MSNAPVRRSTDTPHITEAIEVSEPFDHLARWPQTVDDSDDDSDSDQDRPW